MDWPSGGKFLKCYQYQTNNCKTTAYDYNDPCKSKQKYQIKTGNLHHFEIKSSESKCIWSQTGNDILLI